LYTLVPCSTIISSMKAIVRFDTGVTQLVQKKLKSLDPIMRAVTFCGNTLPVIITLGIGYIVGGDNVRRAFVFIAFCILINVGLKQFIHRPRPDTLYVSLMRFKTHSFPSGHAFGSFTAYGFISYLALVYSNGIRSAVFAGLLWLLIISVGISRVYLGAHYPTDVLGGWILGFLCLIMAVSVF
jgi:membrane-associated phospholipid phosphatase